MSKVTVNNSKTNTLSPILTRKIFESFPNNSEAVKIGTQSYPSSIVELNRPTGKYIHRLLIRLFNLFSNKGMIRSLGNTCAPGLIFPKLENGKGINQFNISNNVCGVVSANILGNNEYPDSVTVEAKPFMVLNLHSKWHSFEDYLSAFTSKYRVRAKKVLKESGHLSKQRIDQLPSNEWIAACGKLLAESLQDKTIALGKNLPQLLHCYHNSLNENFHVYGYYQESKLVGFISCIIDGSNLFAMHLGMDAKVGSHTKLYQRMLMDLVEVSFENSISNINFGRTGTEIKSTLGALPVTNSFVVFTKSKFLLFFFYLYAKFFHKQERYKLRKPFKEEFY